MGPLPIGEVEAGFVPLVRLSQLRRRAREKRRLRWPRGPYLLDGRRPGRRHHPAHLRRADLRELLRHAARTDGGRPRLPNRGRTSARRDPGRGGVVRQVARAQLRSELRRQHDEDQRARLHDRRRHPARIHRHHGPGVTRSLVAARHVRHRGERLLQEPGGGTQRRIGWHGRRIRQAEGGRHPAGRHRAARDAGAAARPRRSRSTRTWR